MFKYKDKIVNIDMCYLFLLSCRAWPLAREFEEKDKDKMLLISVRCRGQCVQIQRQNCKHRYVLLFSLVIVEPGQGVPSPPDGWTAGRHGWLAGDTANVVFRPSPTNIYLS